MEQASVSPIVLTLFKMEPVAFGAVSLYTLGIGRFDYPADFRMMIVTISSVGPQRNSFAEGGHSSFLALPNLLFAHEIYLSTVNNDLVMYCVRVRQRVV